MELATVGSHDALHPSVKEKKLLPEPREGPQQVLWPSPEGDNYPAASLQGRSKHQGPDLTVLSSDLLMVPSIS